MFTVADLASSSKTQVSNLGPLGLLVKNYFNFINKINVFFILAHLSHWLMVSYCDHCMSVVCRGSCVIRRHQLLQRTSPPKVLAGF